MKERIHTIPVNEAFLSGDECPFCYLERQVEQRVIKYTLGSGASYMEPEVRGETDRQGFCGAHLKKMYDFGNTLGNALILQTYFVGLFEEMEQEISRCAAEQEGVLGVDSLKTRVFGNKIYVDIKIYAAGNLSLAQSDQIAKQVHDAIESKFEKIKHIAVYVMPAVQGCDEENGESI